MKSFIVTFLVSFSLLTQAFSVIIESPNLDKFESTVKKADEHSLVIFDVDDTLLISKDIILRHCARDLWNKYNKEILGDTALVPKNKHTSGFFIGQIFSKMEYEVVDPKVIDIIDSLQEKGVRAIALTHMATGSIGAIKSMEDWRIDHLKRHKIDFSLAFPQFQEIKLNIDSHKKQALFKDGVICTNSHSKGSVLAEFLETIEWKPTKIFFIDNNIDYLKSVQDALDGSGIEFYGFYYTEMENRQCEVNKDIARYQITHLAKNDEWISEEQALELMK